MENRCGKPREKCNDHKRTAMRARGESVSGERYQVMQDNRDISHSKSIRVGVRILSVIH